MPYSPQLANFPTLQAECHDTEARSLKKIDDLLVQFVYGQGSIPVTLEELVSAVKGEDAQLSTSGAFVSSYTLFNVPCLMWQIDCFSIAPDVRWVMVQDSASYNPLVFPYYIAPIYSQCSTSLNVTAPFTKGVTVILSTFANSITIDTVANMLVTGVRRT